MATAYGVRPPEYGVPIYPQASMAMTSSASAGIASVPFTNVFVPPPAMGPSFRQPLIGNGVPGSGLPVSSQAFATRSPESKQALAHAPGIHRQGQRQIIIQNLHCEVTESTLMHSLNKLIGQVQRCQVEKREGKKCHAFVTFVDEEQANRAVKKLDHRKLFDREVTARLTKEGDKGPVIVDGSE